MQVTTQRNRITKLACILCMALVFAFGTMYAIHSHPADSETSHRPCSICMAASFGPVTPTVTLLQIAKPVAMVPIACQTFVLFRPVLTNFVRPPPAV